MENSFLALLSDVAVESGNAEPVFVTQRTRSVQKKKRASRDGSETRTWEIVGKLSRSRRQEQNMDTESSDDKDEEESEKTRSLRKKRKKKQFTFFRNEKDARAAGYLYRRLWVVDIPMLTDGEGLQLLQSLGLDAFYKQEIPELNKKWCDSFLSTFDPSTNSGRVDDRVVTLDVESVAHATKLPAEGENVHSTFLKSKLIQLGNFNDKTCRGFNLEHLADRHDFHLFQAIAAMLMIRLEVRRECFQFVSGEVLVALDKSLKTGIQMNWAEYMTTLMRKMTTSMSRKPPSSSNGYPYGEWLTRIIENAVNAGALVEAVEAVRVQEPQLIEQHSEEQAMLKGALMDARLRIFHLERKRDEAISMASATINYLKK